MSEVKVGSKVLIKKDIYSPYAPNGMYGAGRIETVAEVTENGGVRFEGEEPGPWHSGWRLGQKEYFELLPEEKEMTPCEKLGYKIGDAFIAPFSSRGIKTGDIIYLAEDEGDAAPIFAKNKDLSGARSYYGIGETDHKSLAKPYKPQSEAERRGAKFGVGGVVKETGEQVIFQKEDGKWWRVFGSQADTSVGFPSEEIRLDHEPEYKEIPFDEATHEQRMADGAVVDSLTGNTVTEVLRFSDGTYVYMKPGYVVPLSSVHRLKVKVPA